MISEHPLELYQQTSGISTIQDQAIFTDTFSMPSVYNLNPLNIKATSGDANAQSFDLRIRLHSDVLSVPEASYLAKLDDTSGTSVVGETPGTARNHVNRVFDFSLNEG